MRAFYCKSTDTQNCLAIAPPNATSAAAPITREHAVGASWRELARVARIRSRCSLRCRRLRVALLCLRDSVQSEARSDGILRSEATLFSTRILHPDCRPVRNNTALDSPDSRVVGKRCSRGCPSHDRSTCRSVPRPPSNDDDDASYRRPAPELPTSQALRWPQPMSEAMISFS
jgi:hypothetical protein